LVIVPAIRGAIRGGNGGPYTGQEVPEGTKSGAVQQSGVVLKSVKGQANVKVRKQGQCLTGDYSERRGSVEGKGGWIGASGLLALSTIKPH